MFCGVFSCVEKEEVGIKNGVFSSVVTFTYYPCDNAHEVIWGYLHLQSELDAMCDNSRGFAAVCI